MPTATIPPPTIAAIRLPKSKGKSRRVTQPDVTAGSVAADTHIRPSKEIVYETPIYELVRENNDDDDDDDDYDDFL